MTRLYENQDHHLVAADTAAQAAEAWNQAAGGDTGRDDWKPVPQGQVLLYEEEDGSTYWFIASEAAEACPRPTVVLRAAHRRGIPRTASKELSS